MINIIEDIVKIMKYEKSHNVKVVVEPNGITISLSDGNLDDFFDIPINIIAQTEYIVIMKSKRE